MNQQLDSLFKSKLEHHAVPAPTGAWNRIESGLNQSSNQKLWLKIAAGIALFATASILIINSITTAEQPLAQQLIESKDKTDETSTTPRLPHEPVSSATHQVTPPKQLKRVAESPIQEVDQVAFVEVPDEVTEPVALTQINEEIILQPATGLTIVYSAEEVNSKYLLKTPEAEATLEQKKSSRLQKLAVLAHNLSNEDILGDLRDRKNELFALNFLDDKKEKKN